MNKLGLGQEHAATAKPVEALGLKALTLFGDFRKCFVKFRKKKKGSHCENRGNNSISRFCQI